MKVKLIIDRIILMMLQDNEPLFFGEIREGMELHWFTCKKGLDKLIDMDVVGIRRNKFYLK